MIQLVKKIFHRILSRRRNKQVLIFALLFSIPLVFFPFWHILAFGWEWIPEKIGEVILGFILQETLLAAEGFLSLSVALLSWVGSNPFHLSYTNPANNPIIQIGWSLTRDLVNMFFILGLVYIGVATALRLAGFRTKEVFGRLIIVALFVNFTPVICGLVVDGANIFMNFFLGGPGGLGAFHIFDDVFKANASDIMGILTGPPSIAPLVSMASLALFGFIGGFIIFVLAVLLFIRYIAIWILVIFSPFAFFAWIFPSLKRWFQQWWQQLISWSLIGVFAGFFLYMTQHFLALGYGGALFAKITATGIQGADDLANQALPYFGAMIFLVIGLFVSFQSSAIGASFIIKYGKKAAGRTQKVFGRFGQRTVFGTLAGTGRGAKAGWQKTRGESKGVKGFFKGLPGGIGGALGGGTGILGVAKGAKNRWERAQVWERRNYLPRVPQTEEEKKVEAEKLKKTSKIRRAIPKIHRGFLKGTAGIASAVSGAPKGAKEALGREKEKENQYELDKFLEKIHVKPVGWADLQRAKREKPDEIEKNLKQLNSETLHKIVQAENRTGSTRKLAAKILAERSSFATGENEAKEVTWLKRFAARGGDASPVLKARPDLAKQLAVEAGKTEEAAREEVKNIIRKMSPKKYVDTIQSEALKDQDVILATSKTQLENLGKSGSVNQKRAIVRGAKDEHLKLYKKGEKNLSPAERARYDDLRDLINWFSANQNFKSLLSGEGQVNKEGRNKQSNPGKESRRKT